MKPRVSALRATHGLERAVDTSSEWHVYRRGSRSRRFWLALGFTGLVLFTVGLFVGPSLWRALLLVGGVLAALGFGVATEPLAKISPEGITIKRGGYLATDKLVRWSSIRSVEAASERVVLLHLIDGSSAEIRMGSLTDDDREQLYAAIRERTRHS